MNTLYIDTLPRYVNGMNIEQNIDLELARLRNVAWRMDALFYVPRTNISVGLDNIVGLVPVIGDALTALPSLWLINEARKLGASPGTLAYMTLNTVLDFFVGMVPVVGDIFDVIYNANIRNYRALERNLNKKAAHAKTVQTAQIAYA
ncbi:uncharacterized protein DUF4112 [Yoonia maricola]|uniref:Uncharacterized protein DUF4112 n=2 Tax=Yoonia maricola TaxID=420999 RepID=A0A2M8WM70_9RHOB|nr:uncharacterized protein DUF4112 [Yoonia maricola]